MSTRRLVIVAVATLSVSACFALANAQAAITNITVYAANPSPGGLDATTLPLGVSGDYAESFDASGCWQANVTTVNGYTKWGITPTALFGRPVTIGELASITYYTKKATTFSQSAGDWYLQFYTDKADGGPGSWYGHRINSEPYFSANLNAPANQWNQWQTNSDSPNALRFYDSSAGYFGGYTDDFLSGLTTNPTYENLHISSFWVGVGSNWANGFTGEIDSLTITLANGDSAHVNFEAAVPEPATLLVWSLLGATSWLGMRVWRGGQRVSRRAWSPENRQAIMAVIDRKSH
jgi:hypothetical protein